MWSVLLALVVVTICAILLITIVVSFLRTGVPTVASARAAQILVGKVLANASVKTIYELGSGKGDFSMRLAHMLPNAQISGFEISPTFYLFSQFWRLFSKVKTRVHFHLVDFRKINLSPADAVVFYLMPAPNRSLKPKLERELKLGSLVVTISFSMPGWQPMKTLCANNFSKTRVFIYQIPQSLKT